MFPDGPTRFVEAEVADLPPGRAVDLATGERCHAVWLAGQGGTWWRSTSRASACAAPERGRRPRAGVDLVLASFFHPRPAHRRALFAHIDRQCGALAQQGRSSR